MVANMYSNILLHCMQYYYVAVVAITCTEPYLMCLCLSRKNNSTITITAITRNNKSTTMTAAIPETAALSALTLSAKGLVHVETSQLFL